MQDDTTIVAIATPPGNGGVGILRLSGPNSLEILDKVWMGPKSPDQFEPRRLYFGKIKEFQTSPPQADVEGEAPPRRFQGGVEGATRAPVKGK
jgi:tRNA U34 5-carboxymethylaminomethyl modifying GTPase MnmE/TrmE